MAKTIQEWKDIMTAEFISHETIKTMYRLSDGRTFDEQFSKVSLESILFYIVAFAAWTLDTLFDLHRADMEALLDTKKPHRLKWYRDKALAFQFGYALEEDSDVYDNTALTEEQITESMVVKYAAAVEDGSEVLIKVAGGDDTNRQQITAEQETALTAYFKEIRDAGVKLSVINRRADSFWAAITIYYDPMVLDGDGNSLNGGDEPVRIAVEKYIGTLPFNGEYNNMALIDNMQVVPGVVIATLQESKYKYGLYEFIPIVDKVTPDSGYFKIYDPADLEIKYEPYEN